MFTPFKNKQKQASPTNMLSANYRQESQKVQMKRFLQKIQSEVEGKNITLDEKVATKKKPKSDLLDLNVAPLEYESPDGTRHRVTTHKELQDLIQIESFEDAIHGRIREIRDRENRTDVPEIDRDPVNKIDPKFFQLVQESRPVGKYYE